MKHEEYINIMPNVISQAINTLKQGNLSHAHQLNNILVKGSLIYKDQEYIIESEFRIRSEENLILVFNIIQPGNDIVLMPENLEKFKTQFDLL